MQTTIGKWGNSLAIRLPRHVTEAARLVEGASVDLDVEGGTIRITPTRKRFRLSELLAGEPPRDPASGTAEEDWGTSKGDEAW